MSLTEFCRAALTAELQGNPKLTVRAWARSASVSESGLRGFISGATTGISLDYIEKLAEARGKTAFDFLLPAGTAGFAKWVALLDQDDLIAVQRLLTKSIGAADQRQAALSAFE